MAGVGCGVAFEIGHGWREPPPGLPPGARTLAAQGRGVWGSNCRASRRAQARRLAEPFADYVVRRRRAPTAPTRPRPRMPSVSGSGTAVVACAQSTNTNGLLLVSVDSNTAAAFIATTPPAPPRKKSNPPITPAATHAYGIRNAQLPMPTPPQPKIASLFVKYGSSTWSISAAANGVAALSDVKSSPAGLPKIESAVPSRKATS